MKPIFPKKQQQNTGVYKLLHEEGRVGNLKNSERKSTFFI